MRYILFLLAFLPFLASAQPSEVAAKKIRATEKLQLDTAILTQIVRVISAASTHSQSPTAKAVYDFVSSLPGGTNLSFSGTSSPITLNSSTGTDVSFSGGTGIGLSATGATLTVTNTAPDQTVTIAGATGIYPNFTLPDASATNELQNLSLAGQSLGITSGTGVNLPIVGVNAGTGIGVGIAAGIATVSNTGDLSNTNELNTAFAVVGSNLSLSDANGTLSVSVSQIAPDQSITNEAQTLTSGTNSVTLSNVGGVGGGTVTVDTNPNDDITGSGTANFVPKFTGAQAIGSSQIFDNGTYVGVKTTIPTHPLTVLSENSNDNGKIQSWEYSGNAALYNLKLKQTVTSGVVRYNFSQVNNGTAFDNVLVFDRGNVGIGLTDPLSKLHVVGAARITGSGGQATSITGRDANNDLTNITIGSGLSLSGGTLSATGATKWTSGAGGIYNTDLNNVSVGATAVNLSRFRVSGNSANTCARFDAGALSDFGAVTQLTGSGGTIYGNNYSLNATGNATYLFANSNAGANANSLVQFQANGGSPFTQYQLTNGSGAFYAVGIDNSATGDPFKIKSGANLIGLQGITMLSNGFIGINDDAPNTTLDVEGADGIDIPNGTTAERPTGGQIVRFNSSFGGFEALNNSNNVWYRVSSTTSPTASWNSGVIGSGGSVSFATGSNEVAGTIIITAGTAPTGTNVSAITITFANTYNGGATPFPIICQANAITATEWNKFHVGTSNSTLFQIGVAAQLAAGTTYRINYRITQ